MLAPILPLKALFLLVFLSLSLGLKAGDTLWVELKPLFGKEPLQLETEYSLAGTKINIEVLRFYLSEPVLLRGKDTICKLDHFYRLVDLEQPKTLGFSLPVAVRKGDRLFFRIGIDSITNVSGAIGGDLDPTKGMYWTWQSGYINFKLEGTDPRCQSRHHRFQYHLGGYAAPFSSLQNIALTLPKKGKVVIGFAVDRFLQAAAPESLPEIMSPSKRAVELSQQLKNLFFVVK